MGYGNHKGLVIEHTETERIQELLLGRSVVAAGGHTLTLDNGATVEVEPNEGECACSAGDYSLVSLAATPNVITSVEVVEKSLDDYGEEKRYEVFVVAEHKRISLFAVEGDDGNGYYGTGYRLLVTEGINGPPAD